LLCADVVAYQVRLGGIYVDARRQGPGLLDISKSMRSVIAVSRAGDRRRQEDDNQDEADIVPTWRRLHFSLLLPSSYELSLRRVGL